MNSNNDRLNSALTNTSSRRQALKLMAGGILGGAAMATGFKGIAAQTQSNTLSVTPLVGTLEDLTTSVTGELTPQNFFVQDGQVFLQGVFEGVVGEESLTQGFTALLDRQQSSGSCEILDLVIGPIRLDVLGLVVTTDTIHLNITAERGEGNLLGNLLCAVAGLLNPGRGGGLLGRLTDLLNQILGALGLA